MRKYEANTQGPDEKKKKKKNGYIRIYFRSNSPFLVLLTKVVLPTPEQDTMRNKNLNKKKDLRRESFFFLITEYSAAFRSQ